MQCRDNMNMNALRKYNSLLNVFSNLDRYLICDDTFNKKPIFTFNAYLNFSRLMLER